MLFSVRQANTRPALSDENEERYSLASLLVNQLRLRFGRTERPELRRMSATTVFGVQQGASVGSPPKLLDTVPIGSHLHDIPIAIRELPAAGRTRSSIVRRYRARKDTPSSSDPAMEEPR